MVICQLISEDYLNLLSSACADKVKQTPTPIIMKKVQLLVNITALCCWHFVFCAKTTYDGKLGLWVFLFMLTKEPWYIFCAIMSEKKSNVYKITIIDEIASEDLW